MKYETRESTELIKNAIWSGWKKTPLHSVCIETGVGGGKTFGAIHAIGAVPKFKNAYIIIFAPSAKVKDHSWEESVKAYNEAEGTNLKIILLTTPESMSGEPLKTKNTPEKKKRKTKIKVPKKNISLEMLTAVQQWLNAPQPVVLIFDEVHKIKTSVTGDLSEMSQQIVAITTGKPNYYDTLQKMLVKISDPTQKWTKKQKNKISDLNVSQINQFIQKSPHWITASINLSATLIGNNFYYDAVPYFLMAGFYQSIEHFNEVHGIEIETKNTYYTPPTAKHPEGKKRKIRGLNFKDNCEINLAKIKNLQILDDYWNTLVYDPVETSDLLPNIHVENHRIDLKKDRQKIALPQYQEKILRNNYQLNDEEFTMEDLTIQPEEWVYMRPIEWQNLLSNDKTNKVFASPSVPYQLIKLNSLTSKHRYSLWSEIIRYIINLKQFDGKDIIAFYNYNIEQEQLIEMLLTLKIMKHEQIFFVNGEKKEFEKYHTFKKENPKACALILIQYVAGGAAIEFKNAYNALFLSYSPSPINMIQAAGRNTRNGMQGINVYQHYLNVDNDIYDYSIRMLLISKMNTKSLLGKASQAVTNGNMRFKSYNTVLEVYQDLSS